MFDDVMVIEETGECGSGEEVDMDFYPEDDENSEIDDIDDFNSAYDEEDDEADFLIEAVG